MRNLRNSLNHITLLSEIQDFIQSNNSNDLQDFLNECISPKVGLFDLLRYLEYNLNTEHPLPRKM